MANQPSLIPSAWAANNSTTETIPATTTESGKASWDQGFPVETSLPLSEGGIPPKYGDFNGILNVLSQFALFAQSGGQYAWSNTLDYGVGSIVLGTDGSIYRAAQASGPSTAAVNPVGDTSGKWERIVSKSDIDALEADIQTAMSTASDAASNASAAQSAVTTLDANVVKKSGNQEIGGTKTFTSSPVVPTPAAESDTTVPATTEWVNDAIDVVNGNISTLDANVVKLSGNQTVAGTKTFSNWVYAPSFTATTYYSLHRDVSDDRLVMYGGTNTQDGAYLILFGKNSSDNGLFRMGAVSSTASKYLEGKADGTLTWGGNNVITAAGGTISGTLTINNQINARSIIPNVSNSYTLGVNGTRWKEIWCNQSSINTSSDERIKQQIASVPDAVLDAWGDVSWIQFKYNDACEEKGAGKARLHNGLIAQRVDAAFKAHGLDASKYGLFLYDEWDARAEEKDENGTVLQEAQPAGDAYGLRYTEALCMEAAYERRRADRAEARITALEQRLGELEAAIASLISPVEAEDLPYVAQEQDAEQESEEGTD